MVRARRPLRQPAARAVRLFAADAQPAHQPREPAPARCRVRERLRRLARHQPPSAARRRGPGWGRLGDLGRSTLTPALSRARERGQEHSTDARAVHAARRHAEEPCRRLADGAVLGRRRHRGRLPPRASRRPRDGRRRPRRRRDDEPVARRPHHARLPGPVEHGAARRVETHRRFRARRAPTRRSLSSSAIRAPRARRGWPGTASTSRWTMPTGSSSRPRRSSTSTASATGRAP